MRALDNPESPRIHKMTLLQGSYIPTKTGCESEDGIAEIDDVVYLFQVTVSRTHPVNAHGILERLRERECLERFQAGTQKVYLVFVLPSGSYEFKRQTINTMEQNDLVEQIPQFVMEIPEFYGRTPTEMEDLRERYRRLELENDELKRRLAETLGA